jgi:hypothetical protein
MEPEEETAGGRQEQTAGSGSSTPCCSLFLPSASAFCLLFRRSVRLRRVVNLPSLDDIFLVVVDSVAVYVDTHFDLMLLAIVDVTGVKRQTVLTA